MHVIDGAALDAASAAARESPRGRKNVNLHKDERDPSQRLLNAIEPRSYVPPHCHADPLKDETVTVLRGRLGVVRFDEQGNVVQTLIVGPGEDAIAFTVPHGTFHSIVSLAEGTVFFESKAGPYAPLAAHERAAWAPGEQDAEAPAYLERLRALFS